MSERDFRTFIEKQHPPEKPEKKIDWGKQLREWQDFLAAFYEQIESFLSEYNEAGKVTIRREKLQLSEESIGTYFVDSLILEIARQKIMFTPIGTLLIGAKGRVDMTGPSGTVRFVLVNEASSGPRVFVSIGINRKPPPIKESGEDKPITWTWRISTPPPRIQYLPLTKDSFFDALLKTLNG